MSGALSVCGIALSGVLLSLLLYEMGYRGARLLSLASVIGILLYAVGGLSDIFSALSPLIELGGISDAARCAMKVVGIGYLTGICRDISADMGQHAMASSLLVVGKIEIMLVILPTVLDIAGLAIDMI